MANTLYEFYTQKGQKLPTWQQRIPIAQQAGISNYTGTSIQNTALLSYLQKTPTPAPTVAPMPTPTPATALQPAGATLTPTPAPAPRPSPAPTGVSIVDYLKSVGQPSDYSSRATLAAQKGIANYMGTATQNTQLLNVLRTPAPTQLTPEKSQYFQQQIAGIQAGIDKITPQVQPPTQLITPTTPAGTTPTLTPEQISAGYSTIPGPYDPVTGQLKPVDTPTPTGTTPTDNTELTKLKAQIKALEDEMTKSVAPSEEELATEAQLKNLMASKEMGLENIRTQPIAMPFLTGQSAAIQRQAGLQAIPLQNQIANLQAKRAAAMDVVKIKAGFRGKELTSLEAIQKEQRAAEAKAREPEKPPTTAGITEYKYAQSQGYKGTFTDWKKAEVKKAGAPTAGNKASAYYQIRQKATQLFSDGMTSGEYNQIQKELMSYGLGDYLNDFDKWVSDMRYLTPETQKEIGIPGKAEKTESVAKNKVGYAVDEAIKDNNPVEEIKEYIRAEGYDPNDSYFSKKLEGYQPKPTKIGWWETQGKKFTDLWGELKR